MNPLLIGVVLLVLLVDGAMLAWFARRFGVFAQVRVETVDLPEMWLAYEKRTGQYTGVAAVMEPMRAMLARRYGIDAAQGFGIFLDDPRAGDRNNMRSVLGCVLSGGDAARLPETTEGFYLAQLPPSRVLMTRFPYRGAPSRLLGVIRAAGALLRHMERNGIPRGPIMELLDTTASETRYIRFHEMPDGHLESLYEA